MTTTWWRVSVKTIFGWNAIADFADRATAKAQIRAWQHSKYPYKEIKLDAIEKEVK